MDGNCISVRKYKDEDILQMIEIWNEVVEEGIAFPQEELLDEVTGKEFFAAQSYCGVAVGSGAEGYGTAKYEAAGCEAAECKTAGCGAAEQVTERILGLYILHPNNVGRCGHICNASYAVSSKYRGLHIGEKLVRDCIGQAGKLGFGVLQFNAVVATNIHARHLYERIGFQQLGTIPKGFRLKDGTYEDICPYYIEINQRF